MWFLGFVLVAATCLSLLVYGWAMYLERATAAVTAALPAVEATAPVLLPTPRPRPRAQPARVEVREVVSEPKPSAKDWRRVSKDWHSWNARKSAVKARGKSRQTGWHETW
jgi:hypothetical protein